MRPNSTGYICMTYHVSINTYRSKPDQLSPIHIGRYSCVMVNGENQCLPNDSHSFQNTVIPNNITLSGSFSFYTVVHVVRALSNATGFYDYSAPTRGSCWLGVRMAVGYSASQVNATDFTQPLVSSCPGGPALDVAPVAEFVSGMNVTNISTQQ
jgi:hypothetical protein